MTLNYQILSDSNDNKIKGPLLISPNVFKDERGFFMESWNYKEWNYLLKENQQISIPFLQDNHSKSSIGVLRGLHYQIEPNPQGKLVRCIAGEIYDVAVDIRKNSPTFGKYVGAILSSLNHNQLWIPAGFAHGFLTISKIAEVTYKTTSYWDKASERSIIWDDPTIKINWPLNLLNQNELIISSKDSAAPSLKELDSQDIFN